MDAQLAKVRRELVEASSRIKGLAKRLPEEALSRRPGGGGWSVAHCVMHLNKTTEEFLPKLDTAIREAREKGLTGVGPFRRNLMGWVLCKMVEPFYRMKVKTPPKFDPQDVETRERAMAGWERWQDQLFERLAAADGLALDRVKVSSPFTEKMKYNLLAAFMVIAAHQRRHIWQAERIVAAVRG